MLHKVKARNTSEDQTTLAFQSKSFPHFLIHRIYQIFVTARRLCTRFQNKIPPIVNTRQRHQVFPAVTKFSPVFPKMSELLFNFHV